MRIDPAWPLAAALCLAGCGVNSTSEAEQAVMEENAARQLQARQPAADPVLSTAMTCTPAQARGRDTIAVTLPGPHGGDLAIVNPNGDYYFLAYDETGRGGLAAPISAARYAGMTTLALPIATQEGVSIERNVRERVFVPHGRYRIVSSANLETDDPVLDGSCDITLMARGGKGR